MKSRLAVLSFIVLPAIGLAQQGMSQARLEADCLARPGFLVPGDLKPVGSGFGALGNYASYYVVTYRFAGDLKNGSRPATCTYRRDGQWVRDDAAAYRLARELQRGRRP